MNLPIILKFLALVLGFALWAALGYLGKVPLDPLIALLQMGLGGLITHMLQAGGAPAVQSFAAAAPAAAPAPGAQGGFISMRLLSIIAAVALVLTALFGCAGAPTVSQVQAIKNACAIDAGIRPSVTVLLAMPGLAKPEEIAAVTAARAVIDPICANPAGTPQENALAAVTSASATVLGIVTDLQARKAAPAK